MGQSSSSNNEDFTQVKSILAGLFSDLAARSPNDKTMDKRDFLTLFNLPGMLGERLFTVFDTKSTGVIDYEEFINGIKYFMTGNIETKLSLVFQMYDLAGDGVVNPQELKTMLLSLVEGPSMLFNSSLSSSSSSSSQKQYEEKTDEDNEVITETNTSDYLSVNDYNAKLSRSIPLSPNLLPLTPRKGRIPSLDDDFKTKDTIVDEIVKQAFDECDISGDGKLNFDEFQLFIKKHPEILQTLEEVFLFERWGGYKDTKHRTSITSLNSNKIISADDYFNTNNINQQDIQIIDEKDHNSNDIIYQGYLWKQGSRLKQWKKIFYFKKFIFISL